MRTRDEGVVTVHEGHAIGSYTVREIKPDRIRLASPDDEVTLLIGAAFGDEAPSRSAADAAAPDASAESRFMAAGINTDQSLPKHVVYGPTATWPAGEKHVH